VQAFCVAVSAAVFAEVLSSDGAPAAPLQPAVASKDKKRPTNEDDLVVSAIRR
jgi:hypothetical protein